MEERIFDGVVGDLTVAPGVRMAALLVSGPDATSSHDFTGRGFARQDVRSISKVAVALAVGAAVAEGVEIRGEPLSLDLEIGPLLPGRELPGVRLRHLLTNTIGHDEGFLFRADLGDRDRADLLPHVFAHEPVHPPGAHFAYSNVGWYLFSVLLTEALGTGLRRWVHELVLDDLGIADPAWTRYGRYEAGATGLHLSAPEVARLGALLVDGGRHRGRQVVPRAWVDAMCSPAVPASGDHDPPLRATAYGYGLWICPGGIAYCDGADGQFLVVVPERRTVVVALAEAGDTGSVSRCLGPCLAPR